MHVDASSNSSRDALYPPSPSKAPSSRFFYSASSTSIDAASSPEAVTRNVNQLAVNLTQLVGDIQRLNTQTLTTTTITTLPARASSDRPFLPVSQSIQPTASIPTTAVLKSPFAIELASTAFRLPQPSASTPSKSSVTEFETSSAPAIPSPSQNAVGSQSSNPASPAIEGHTASVSTDSDPPGDVRAAPGMSASTDALSVLSVADEAFKTTSIDSNIPQPTSATDPSNTVSSTSSTPSQTNPPTSSQQEQQGQNSRPENSITTGRNRTILIASAATGGAVILLLLGLLLFFCLRRRRRRRHQAALVRAGTPNSLPRQRPASSSLLDNMLQSHPHFFAPAAALANARHQRTTTLPSPPLRPHPALRTPALSTLDEMTQTSGKGGATTTTAASHERDGHIPRKPPPIAKSSPPYKSVASPDPNPKISTSPPAHSPPPPNPPPKRSLLHPHPEHHPQQHHHRHNPSTFSQAHTLAPPPSSYSNYHNHQRMHSTATRPGSARPGSARPGTAGTTGTDRDGVRRSWVTSSSVTAPGSSYNPFDLA